jgi:prolipoprotein diacylglyceryl transferase
VRYLDFADAAAPGIAVAQGIGRWGNWFNNELYGGPTDLPWGLEIHKWDASAGRAVTDAKGDAIVQGVYHPTFLYESVFVMVLAIVLLLIERHWRLARGQLFGLYVAGYPIGRILIEKMRTDDAELILGQRLNVWTSIVVFLLGVAIVVHTGRRARSSRDDVVQPGEPASPTGADGSGNSSTM